jgi:hypothetical protein
MVEERAGTPTSNSSTRWVQHALGFGISLACIVALAWHTDWHPILRAVVDMRPAPIVLALLLVAGCYLLQGLRWRRLLNLEQRTARSTVPARSGGARIDPCTTTTWGLAPFPRADLCRLGEVEGDDSSGAEPPQLLCPPACATAASTTILPAIAESVRQEESDETAPARP